MGLGIATFISSILLKRHDTHTHDTHTHDTHTNQDPTPQKQKSGGGGEEKKVEFSRMKDERVLTQGIVKIGGRRQGKGGGGVLENKSFRLLLLNVFLCQVGNALLASTQPLFVRHVRLVCVVSE